MKKPFEYKTLKVEPQPNPALALLFKVYLKNEKDPKYYIFAELDLDKSSEFKNYVLKVVKKDANMGFVLEEVFRAESQTMLLEYIYNSEGGENEVLEKEES